MSDSGTDTVQPMPADFAPTPAFIDDGDTIRYETDVTSNGVSVHIRNGYLKGGAPIQVASRQAQLLNRAWLFSEYARLGQTENLKRLAGVR